MAWTLRAVLVIGLAFVVVGGSSVAARTGSGATAVQSRPAAAAADSDTAAPEEDPSSDDLSGGDLPVVASRTAVLTDRPAATVHVPVTVATADGAIVSDVVPVGVDDRLGIAVPDNADDVGWYRFGPAPGAPGVSVLAGHVDYDGRPGPFFELRGLAVGEQLTVGYADGTSRSFRVTETRQFPKGELERSGVIADAGDTRLVLITCGGSFDRSQRSYSDNIAVTAVPIDAPGA